MDGIGLVTRRTDISRVGLGLLALAIPASLAATVTGQGAFDAAIAAGAAPALLNQHADLAALVPWLLLLVAAARWLGAARWGRWGHGAALILGLALWPFVYRVGHSGGELVFRHGIGVDVSREARAP